MCVCGCVHFGHTYWCAMYTHKQHIYIQKHIITVKMLEDVTKTVTQIHNNCKNC